MVQLTPAEQNFVSLPQIFTVVVQRDSIPYISKTSISTHHTRKIHLKYTCFIDKVVDHVTYTKIDTASLNLTNIKEKTVHIR